MTIAKTLLATTALVACVTAASAGQKLDRPIGGFVPRWMNLGVPGHVLNGFPVTVMTRPGTAPVRSDVLPRHQSTIFDNIAWLDNNGKWLSYYGFTLANDSSCYDYSSNYHYCFYENGNNALAFHGTGRKAKKIGVPLFGETASTTANVGIYSATASGLPGSSELAGGSCTPSSPEFCWIDVNIFLNKGQEYFLEVSCATGQKYCYGGWEGVDVGEDWWHVHENETEYYYGATNTYTYSSPWHETSIEGQGAAIIR